MRFSSRPLFLLVALLAIATLSLAGFWIASLPRLSFNQMQRIAEANGMALGADDYSLSFSNGFVLVLDNVELSPREAAAKGLLTARIARVSLSLANLFGIARQPGSISLEAPVFDVDLRAVHLPTALAATTITVTDAVARLRDPQHDATLAAREINGSWTSGNNGQGRLVASGLLNDVLTTLVVDVDEVAKLGGNGSPVDISLSSKSVDIAFSGRLRLEEALQLDGQVSIESDDTKDLLQIIGAPLKSLADDQPMHVEAGVSTTGAEAALNFTELKLGGAKAQGKALLVAGPDRARLSGALSVDKVILLSNPVQLAAPWREEALAFSDLLSLDADLKLKAEETQIGKLRTGPATVDITVTNGKLALAARSGTVAGGQGSLDVTLQHGQGKTDGTFRLSAKAIDANTALGGTLGFNLLKGPVDVSAYLNASGTNVAAMISTLAGNASLSTVKAALSGFDLNEITKADAGSITVAPDAETVDLAMNLGLDLEEGVATLSSGELKTADVSLKPRGEVDLLRQALSVDLNPQAKSGSKPAPKKGEGGWRLTGQWTQPQISTGAAPLRLGTDAALPAAAPAN